MHASVRISKYLMNSFRKRYVLPLYRLLGARVTKRRIVADLRSLGLEDGDVIFVHSSLSKIGYVDGGADTVIDALIEVVGNHGTIVMPAFTINGSMKNALESGFLFDSRSSMVTVGLIPETFRKRPGVYRSVHPTHSMSAYGRLAEWITEGHEYCQTTFGTGTPFYKLMQVNGKILGLGVDLGPVTFYHVIEDVVDNFSLNVYCQKRYQVKVMDSNSKEITMTVKAHNPNVSKTRIEKNPWIKKYFTDYLTSQEVLKFGFVGKAKSWTMKAKELFEAQKDLLKRNITIYTCEDEIVRN